MFSQTANDKLSGISRMYGENNKKFEGIPNRTKTKFWLRTNFISLEIK